MINIFSPIIYNSKIINNTPNIYLSFRQNDQAAKKGCSITIRAQHILKYMGLTANLRAVNPIPYIVYIWDGIDI
jgi:hypothetical protein